MAAQLPLFETSLVVAAMTFPSPLCIFERCSRNGRALYEGDPVDLGGCVNRTIVCVTCNRRGVESTRTKEDS